MTISALTAMDDELIDRYLEGKTDAAFGYPAADCDDAYLTGYIAGLRERLSALKTETSDGDTEQISGSVSQSKARV